MHMSPAVLGPPVFLPVYLKAVRAGFPSPADDYLDLDGRPDVRRHRSDEDPGQAGQ